MIVDLHFINIDGMGIGHHGSMMEQTKEQMRRLSLVN